MNWRFTIIDRNNVSTVIDEPVGWDANVSEIKRDTNWHGIFFNNQGDTFEFHKQAMRLLKKEYEEYGSEGIMTLVMEEDCGNGYEEFSRGSFVFSKYEYYCGDSCYVKIPVETTSSVMDLRNRINQKVNLETTKAFDETTTLTAYDRLPFELLLPSKAIVLQDKAEWVAEQTITPNLREVGPGNGAAGVNYAWFNIVPQFEKVTLSEIGTFSTDASPNMQWVCGADLNSLSNCPTVHRVVTGNNTNTDPARMVLFEWSQNTPLLVNEAGKNNFSSVNKFNLDISFAGEVEILNTDIIAFYLIVVIRRADGITYDYLDKVKVINALYNLSGFPLTGTFWPIGTTQSFSHAGSYADVVLNDGDYLFASIAGECIFQYTDIADEKDCFNFKFTSGSVTAKALSKSSPTTAKVFAINETISRITESITNDKLRAYSEYFGRTDSEPYSHANDGCGGLEVLTDGTRIRRQENKIPGKTNVFALSLQDAFDMLSPIHNIGMGVEPDTNRLGYNRLRVEPWHFFYNDSVVISCIGINKITRKANLPDIFSTFQFGYNKWEAEEYNGLDEFLTKRNYRTSLSQIKNDLTKLSTAIASGYALEITRRKGNEDSKDWRYDKDTFIVCCKRSNYNVYTNGASYMIVRPSITSYLSPGGTIEFSNAGALNGTHYASLVGNIGDGTFFSIAPYTTAPAGDYTADISVNGTPLPNININVELGNVTSPANIIDPDSIYNYRISPIRNAMRWMSKILQSYRKYNSDSKIIFTDGDGNYFAEGEMTSTACKLEAGVVKENQTVDPATFDDADNAMPIMRPERVTFEYPISSRDYKLIEANPYGLIYFEGDCEEGYGWIDTIQYKPEEGIATFILIPKF